ncbi:hypothetical protein E2C01_003109 [Portunus trituberculatus]|uniref:Secreted protein n=1 Tax=Portunus trituberculatus TaxID=210409 RepID=A0A5B7CLA9_PORTR|nr:hypothetical protein [Portunus trituberculatus]
MVVVASLSQLWAYWLALALSSPANHSPLLVSLSEGRYSGYAIAEWRPYRRVGFAPWERDHHSALPQRISRPYRMH